MADRRRKGSANRVSLNCQIDAEVKAYLIDISGEMALGWTVEELVRMHKELRNATASIQQVPSSRKIQ
jgi:hypothetical protein